MLVLSRTVDQVIQIGADIHITVVKVRGDKVYLGITAPQYVPVHRLEVAQAIAAEGSKTKDFPKST